MRPDRSSDGARREPPGKIGRLAPRLVAGRYRSGAGTLYVLSTCSRLRLKFSPVRPSG
jgi:hypothetical protein